MIPLSVPNLNGRESEHVGLAIASGWVGPDGPYVERFEDMVAKASGRMWAVATITGTAALHASADVLGFGGKRVNVPVNAFPAMRNILLSMSCQIKDVRSTHKHDNQTYGYEPFDTWLADRAPAIGEVPSAATLDCYSFAANKIVTCGHGGAVVGDDLGLKERVREVIRQGYDLPGMFNYRMANLNAAIGCAQMERLQELKDAKRRIWNRYRDAGLPMIERGASRWMATVDLPHEAPDRLWEQGIECRNEPTGGVSIPCSTGLTETDQDRVIKACVSFL